MLTTLLLILLSSVYLISKSLSLNFDQYQQYRNAIFELQKLDSTFNQEILKSRYELFADYDPLVRSLDKQKEPILAEISNLLKNRENLSEKFKSRNALLKNSLRYLPLLTSQLDAKFDTQERAKILTSEQISSLRSTLNGLIRNLLLYNVAVDENLTLEITNLTQKLSQLDVQYELNKEQFPTELVKSHANIILTIKPQIEQLTSQLLQPLDQYTESLEKTVDQIYQKSVQRVNIYRLFTCIWFLMLLILANYFVLKKMHQMNPGLSRYKKRIGKLTNLLTDISQTRQASWKTAPISTSIPTDIPSDSDSNLALANSAIATNSEAQLIDLADRSDELGQLAKRIQELVGKNLGNEQIATDESTHNVLTTRLILATKNRRRMISPTTIESLKNIFNNALEERSCQLIEVQGSLEQVQKSRTTND